MLPDYVKDKFTQLEKRLYDELLAEHKADPNRGLANSIKRLQEQKDSLVKSFVPDSKTEDRITSESINDFYSGVLVDTHRLFGAGDEIEKTLSSYTKFSEMNLNRLRGSLRSHEHKIKKLQFLRDNKEYAEAKAVDLLKNSAPENQTVFSSAENTLSLSVVGSKIVKNAEVSASVLGASENTSLPDYQADKMFDVNPLTSWYTIASFKEKPTTFIDTSTNSVLSEPIGYTENSTTHNMNIGDVNIPVRGANIKVGEPITIGNPSFLTSEVLLVQSVTDEYVTVGKNLTVKNTTGSFQTGLSKKHYSNEPIYRGANVKPSKGAVAIVDFKFENPMEINLLRLAPFSSKPMTLHGLFVPAKSSSSNEWDIVDGTYMPNMSSVKSVSFNRIIETRVRIIVEQPYGELVSEEINLSEDVDSVAWDAIYEKEFNTKVQSIDSKLEMFDSRSAQRATEEDYRGFLLRRRDLQTIEEEEYDKEDGTSGTEEAAELARLDRFFNGDPVEQTQIVQRWIYDIGLTEVEFFFNEYKANSYFESGDLGLRKNPSSFSVIAEEDLGVGLGRESIEDGVPKTGYSCSVHHDLILGSGEEIPLVNQSNFNSNGEVESREELLDVDPTTRKAILRFQPASNKVFVSRLFPKGPNGNVDPNSYSILDVDALRAVTLPETFYDINNAYAATYPVEDPDSYIEGNIPSEEVTFRADGTDENGFLVLHTAPYVEYGIINDEVLFKRPNEINARYIFNSSDSINTDVAIPSKYTIVDNIYYGIEGGMKLERDSSLETEVLSTVAAYSGDEYIKMNQFFNKYHGSTLPESLVYEPVKVWVDGERASNLTSYNGNPHSGFVSSIDSNLQFRQHSNRLLFAASFKGDIEVKYRVKSSSFRYKATLNSNRKSNFWIAPKLKNVLVSSL